MRAPSVMAFIVSLTLSGAAQAQMVLKNEPPQGGLRSGEVVLVDNGKCPKGQIQKVTAGYFGGGRSGAAGAGARTRECVPRQ